MKSQQEQFSVQQIKQSTNEQIEKLQQLEEESSNPKVKEWVGMAIAKYKAGLTYAEKAINSHNIETQQNGFSESDYSPSKRSRQLQGQQ